MKIFNILTLTFFSVVLFSCGTQKVAHEGHNKEQAHWGYTGAHDPSHWSDIKAAYRACAGHSQSPIDIDHTQSKQLAHKNDLKLHYGKSPIDILNNGHTEEFVISGDNSLTFNGKKYQLKQFHMHTLSEHTVDGKHFPLEIHFVNKASDDTYAVISVLVKEGEESDFLAHYLSHFPEHEGEYKAKGKLDIMSVLPSTEHYYHYQGSFTTPPCTEVVEWIVLKENPTASKAQLKRLHQLMHDNYRPVQPLNQRVIDVQ